MPLVKLKLTRWMCQNLNIAPPGSGELCVPVPDGESILGMIRRLAAESGGFWTTILADYPATAQLSNIQCENCHGPQASGIHVQGAEARISISSDVCATCHGEPPRHGRFQQWEESGHSNFELAIEEGEDGNCGRCHSG